MALKFALSALLLVAVLSAAQALRCNVCVGSLTSDCFNGKASSSAIQNCVANVAQNKMVPFLKNISLPSDQTDVPNCIQLVVKAKHFEKPAVERACVVVPANFDVCKELAAIIPIEKCKACKDKDLCNNQPIGK